MPKGSFYPYRPAKGKMTAIQANNDAIAREMQRPSRPCPVNVGDKIEFKQWQGDEYWHEGVVTKTEWLALTLVGKFHQWWSIKVEFDYYPYNALLDDEKPEEFRIK